MNDIKKAVKIFAESRSKPSWLSLISYYGILWLSVLAFWMVYMYIFQQTIDERAPSLTLADSTIGVNPGLAIRPRPPKNNLYSSLIHFKSSSSGDWQYWTESIKEYLKPYQELQSDAGQHAQGDCNSYSERDPNKFCPFDIRVIPNECTEAQNFSYHLGKPCVLVKLNRIYGWKPEPYLVRPENYPVQAPFREGQIQVTCEGKSNIDKENIGSIEYYPTGIETKYFPFTNQPGYQSPFVMVHFKSPRSGIVIVIECKAWARNIVHDKARSRALMVQQLRQDLL